MEYLKAIKQLPQAKATELRTELQGLLRGINQANTLNIDIIHEPKRDQSGLGAPDLKLKRLETIVGYVETKSIGTPLDKVLKSEQMKKYQALSATLY